MTDARLVTAPTPAELAALVAGRFLALLQERVGSVSHICLTGGSMGGAVLRAVAALPASEDIDWSDVHFWWGDERFVARADADRNAVQSREALLDHIPVPAENVHEVAASDSGLGLDEAAAAYAAELAGFGTADQAWPGFVVCFLGVGPDAHVASLFPGRAELAESDAAALPVRNSPKPPPERVTLTRPVLNSSERVWFVLTGADKADALRAALGGAPIDEAPVAGVHGVGETVFFADEAAAGA